MDTALTETLREFRAIVENSLADNFLSGGYGHGVCLSESLRVISATCKRFYCARNCRQVQHVDDHDTKLYDAIPV